MSQQESDMARRERIFREAMREQEYALANDRRRAKGLPPRHCGVDAVRNDAGDYDCAGRCGELGIA